MGWNSPSVDGIVKNGSSVDAAEPPIKLQDLHPQDPTVKTHSIGPKVIEGIETPSSGDLNPAWGVVQVGLAAERVRMAKLNRYADEVQTDLNNINRLLSLNAALTSLKEQDLQISPEMQKIIDELKSHGIEIWHNQSHKMTKDQFSQFKLNVSSQIEKRRTNIQTTVSTKIGPENNNLNIIWNAVKDMLKTDSESKKNILRNVRQ